MPATTKAQLRAMEAAKRGRSKLGIPKEVGEDFAEEAREPAELPQRKKASPMVDAMRRRKP